MVRFASQNNFPSIKRKSTTTNNKILVIKFASQDQFPLIYKTRKNHKIDNQKANIKNSLGLENSLYLKCALTTLMQQKTIT
jgi:hypothetical protein